jgi:hypothetical protein
VPKLTGTALIGVIVLRVMVISYGLLCGEEW